MQALTRFIILFILLSIQLYSQEREVDRLMQSELKMTFPSIYFKHKSTDYAKMPYTLDSCFKHIALNYNKDINSLVIWRDTMESEALTKKRIKKLNVALRKYIKNGDIEIYSMQQEQKISRRTIKQTADKTKVDYLLTQNSVFDISKTHIPYKRPEHKKERKGIPRLVWTGWRTGFHWSSAGGTKKKKESGK